MEYEQTYARQITILNEIIGSLNDYYSFLVNDLMSSYGLCSVWKDNVIGALVSKITNYTHDLDSLNRKFSKQADMVISYYVKKGSSRRYCQNVTSKCCYFSSSYDSNTIYVDTDRVKDYVSKLQKKCERMSLAYDFFKNATSVNYDPDFSNIFSKYSDLRRELRSFIQNQIYLHRVILRCMELYEFADNGISSRHYSIKAIQILSEYLKSKGYNGVEDINDLYKRITQNDIDPNKKMSKKDFIEIYEYFHEDEKNAIDEFFRRNGAPNGDITEADIENIKYLAYRSEGAAHKAFFENIDKCTVTSWNSAGTAFYGKEKGETENGIHVNISDCRKDNYRSLFHEIGHHIDDLIIQGADGKDATDVLHEVVFPALYSDLTKYIRNQVIDYNQRNAVEKLNNDSLERVIAALLDGRKKYEYYLNQTEQDFFKEVLRHIESKFVNNGALSDVIGGLTNNTIGGIDSDDWGVKLSTSGHYRRNKDGREYWYKGNESTGFQEKEFIAHYMSYAMNGDKVKLEELRKVFPEATKIVDNLLMEGNLTINGIEDIQKADEWYKSVTNT